jgi:hypothetical protein
MKQVTIPFNVDHMTVNEMKQVIGAMHSMLDAAYEMRDAHKNIPEAQYLMKCDDFFWKFKTVTKNMTTYSIEKEKQDA